jgi:hypothetical protein
MPTKEFCDDQIERLAAGMTHFRQDKLTLREYADALFAVCRSNEVARLVIDEALETCVDVPSIADIHRMASERNPAPEPEHCATCGGSGYTSASYLLTWVDGKLRKREKLTQAQAEKFCEDHHADMGIGKQMIHEGSEPCGDCRLGRAIKAGRPAAAAKKGKSK